MIEIRSFRDLLRLFYIFKREARIAFLSTLVVVVLGAFLLPSKYEASARLLVKPGRENATLPIEVSNRQTLFAPSSQRDPVVDEEKLLAGKLIAQLVATDMLELLDSYEPQSKWEAFKHSLKKGAGAVKEGVRNVLVTLYILEEKTFVERLTDRLEKNFTVSHEAGSAVMELQFVWGDSELAGQILTRWIDIYLEERARSLGRASLLDFYDREIVNLDEHIGQLKKALQGHYQQINSAGIKDSMNHLTTQIHNLRDLRLEKTNEMAGLSSFIENAGQRIDQYPKEVVTDREFSLNPTQLDLKLKLNRLQEERAALLRTFLEGAPQIKKMDESIAAMQKLIAQQQTRLERSQNRAPNSIVTGMQQDIADAELRLQRLQDEVVGINGQIAELTEERATIINQEPEISRLTMQLDSAEKSYALYTENLEKARIDKALDSSLISNISIVEPANAAAGRIFPKTLLLLLLSVPFAAGCSLLVIYLSYLVDQRIHDGSRIEERFAVPLWGVLPQIEDASNVPALFEASLYRIISMLPLKQIQESGLVIAFTSTHQSAGVGFVIERLKAALQGRGIAVQTAITETKVGPGQVVLLDAGSLVSNPEALWLMQDVDLRVVVIEAGRTTVPMLGNALSIMNSAFDKVDGVVLNRRQFEVPQNVLKRLERLQGEV